MVTGTAFSNGTEFEAWAVNWCSRCMCDEFGYADQGVYCPILTNVMAMNEVPPEWRPGTDDYRDRYHCKEFEKWHPE